MANVKNNRREILRIIFLIIIALLLIYLEEKITISEEEASNSETHLNLIETEGTLTQGELKLTMIDVGQADCFLFEQDGNYALVDCGTRSDGDDIVKYLESQGITKLDYVFGTHPHEDHMGGMYDVITSFDIGKIVIPEVKKMSITTAWYAKLMSEIKIGRYEVIYPEVGDLYLLGNAKIEVLGPLEETSSNLNNYSTVMMVSFGDMDVLMTGDAEKEVEKEIISNGTNLDAEILKVGHHGSDTSSCEEFLDAVNPDYALISTKVGNKYNHPSESTMKQLKEKGIEVYRTDECGTVIVTITSDAVSFNTKSGDYLSGPELEERMEK